MSEKKDVKKVKRGIKKLERVVRKGHVKRIQRKFKAIERAIEVGALKPEKPNSSEAMVDWGEPEDQDGISNETSI